MLTRVSLMPKVGHRQMNSSGPLGGGGLWGAKSLPGL
jgi:hypothetical protein